MTELNETVYNVSTIFSRFSKKNQPKKTDLHLFARGLYKSLTEKQIDELSSIINLDYERALLVISEAKKKVNSK